MKTKNTKPKIKKNLKYECGLEIELNTDCVALADIIKRAFADLPQKKQGGRK